MNRSSYWAFVAALGLFALGLIGCQNATMSPEESKKAMQSMQANEEERRNLPRANK